MTHCVMPFLLTTNRMLRGELGTFAGLFFKAWTLLAILTSMTLLYVSTLDVLAIVQLKQEHVQEINDFGLYCPRAAPAVGVCQLHLSSVVSALQQV